MPVEYIRQRLYSHSNLMSDSHTPQETKAAAATRKRHLAAMDPEQLEEALKCAEERSSQNRRRINEIDQELVRLEEDGAAAAAISDNDPLTYNYSCLVGCPIDQVNRSPSPTEDANAEVERSPSTSENNYFMQRDYASPDLMQRNYAPPNSVSY